MTLRNPWHLFLSTVLAIGHCGCQSAITDKLRAPMPIVEQSLPKQDSHPTFFKTCEEISVWQETKRRSFLYEYSKFDAWQSSQPWGGVYSEQKHSTNLQETGLDEPDIFKMDENFFYVARTQTVEIIHKKNLMLHKTLSFPDLKKIKLFLSEDRLIVLSETHTPALPVISVYFFSRTPGISLQHKREFRGSLFGARLFEQQLLLLAENDLSWVLPPEASVQNFFSVPCEAVQYPIVDDFGSNFTALHQIPLKDLASTLSAGVIGHPTNQTYVNNNILYLVSDALSWFWWDTRLTDKQITSLLTKFELRKNAPPRYLASGKFSGTLRNSWAMIEIENDLYIASQSNGENSENRLLKIRQLKDSHDLVLSGFSDRFGIGERIQSVRFVKDKAYVVTFRTRDPLFVLQLNPNTSPDLLGHLEVEGFSGYLHPLSETSLFGVGYGPGGRGVQFSLFDTSDPLQPKAISQHSDGRRSSFVGATENHHELYVDIKKKLAVIPVTFLQDDETTFSGAYVLNFGSEIRVAGKLSHEEWVPSKCKAHSVIHKADIRRITEDDGQLITVSPFGIKMHQKERRFQDRRASAFANNDEECDRLFNEY